MNFNQRQTWPQCSLRLPPLCRFLCCISSSQTAWGTAERHEGWRHPPPGYHRQDTPCGSAATNVREEYPQPIGQPGPRGHCSEPVTDRTADAGATLNNPLAYFTLPNRGQLHSPHRQCSRLPPPSATMYSTVRLVLLPLHPQPISGLGRACAAGLYFEKTGTVDVGWERMDESVLFLCGWLDTEVFLLHWESDRTPLSRTLNCGHLLWPVLTAGPNMCV